MCTRVAIIHGPVGSSEPILAFSEFNPWKQILAKF